MINYLTLPESDTFHRILPFILAALLIFIIPMFMRRYGLEMEDVIHLLFGRIGKKDYSAASEEERQRRRASRPEPHLSNGGKNEIIQLVSTLLIFVRRNKLGLVYPATIEYKGKAGTLAAIVVTRHEAVGLNCFGFSGKVTETDEQHDWNQHMNNVDSYIPNPLVLNKQQYSLARKALDDAGLKNLPFRVVAVYTNKHVDLVTEHIHEVMNVDQLIKALGRSVQDEEATIDPGETSLKINNIVKKITR